jgi:CheY-like chemotaxis protein
LPNIPLTAHTRKILIVEDDRATAAVLMGWLRGAGHTVVVAYDAMSGFSTAVRERPDVVMVDLSMPAGGGFSILDRMKNIPALANTPMIVMTATDSEANRERAERIGVAAFLLKPIDADELARTVATVTPNS